METPADLLVSPELAPVHQMMTPALQAQGAPEYVFQAWFDFIRAVALWKGLTNGDNKPSS